ncbi:MAG: hypothetical protein OWU33_00290 [Firmicutes bacterium]|nr:hypothetical protein [Bacillota bacterium]
MADIANRIFLPRQRRRFGENPGGDLARPIFGWPWLWLAGATRRTGFPWRAALSYGQFTGYAGQGFLPQAREELVVGAKRLRVQEVPVVMSRHAVPRTR